jgi:hypothetical protein
MSIAARKLFEEKCASCHGTFGESNEVFTPLVGGTTKDDIKTGRVKGLSSGELPQRTTFTKVATISTVFDYIQRAMPWTAPKSLKPDDVYAILAYMLNLAEMVPADFVLSDKNIGEVQKMMPNRNGMTTDHGMWPGASAAKGGIGNGGKPDVQNKACMKNCKTEVKIGSTLPDYARTAHGELALSRTAASARCAESRRLAARPAPRRRQVRTLELATRKRLHGLPRRQQQDRRPRLQRSSGALQGSARRRCPPRAKVKNGGQGVWGSVPMPPNGEMKDADITTLVAVDPVRREVIFTRGEVMNNQRRNVLKTGSGAALLSVLAAAGIIKPRGWRWLTGTRLLLTPRAWLTR